MLFYLFIYFNLVLVMFSFELLLLSLVSVLCSFYTAFYACIYAYFFFTHEAL